MKIGEKIKQLYVSDGITQTEFAKRCGLEPYEVSRIVTGKRRPQLHQLQAIANESEVPLEQLVAGTDSEDLIGEETKYVLKKELDAVLQKALKAETDARALTIGKETLEKELTGLKSDHRETNHRNQKLQSENDVLQKEVRQLTTMQKNLDATNTRLRIENAGLKSNLQKLQKRHADAANQYANLRSAYQVLQNDCDTAWRSYEVLAEEHSVQLANTRRSTVATAGIAGLLGFVFGSSVEDV